MHPPKPFTDEWCRLWCRLHPGQGQCPDDIIGASIQSDLLTLILAVAILVYVYFLFKRKKVI